MSDFPPPQMPPPLPPELPPLPPSPPSSKGQPDSLTSYDEKDSAVDPQVAKMGLVLRCAFYAMTAVQTLALLSFYKRYDFVDRLEQGLIQSPMEEANEVDSFVSSMSRLTVLLSLLIFVLLATWLFQVTRANRTRGASFTFSDGWLVGGFFIPIANFYIPFKFLSENIEFSHRGHLDFLTLKRYLNIWWFGFILVVVLNRIASNLPSDTIAEVKTSDVTSMAAALALIVSCVFASLVVDTLSSDEDSENELLSDY